LPEALAGFGVFPVTAGEDFHPALRTCGHLTIEMARAATVSRDASRARPNYKPKYQTTKAGPMNPNTPSNHRLMATVDATWPPAEFRALGPWLLRRGDGGGQRVSAASTADQSAVLAPAEAGMRAWDQPPLFRVTDDQTELDCRLDDAGYVVKDPVVLYSATVASLADGSDETAKLFRVTAPLAMIDEIWTQGDIGPGRRAVMTRPTGPHVTLLARADDRPVGVAFVALDKDIAMIHAIEVAPAHRRKGGGGILMRGAANFAAEHGAEWLTLAVTEANTPARALYERLGMVSAGRYHYRIKAD
jgi:ribosomal protein S18 acetylase RimI-like enzyme